MNHKRIERLYREEKLAIRRRGRQKRGLGGHSVGGWCPIAANQRWSLDFTEDCLANGRQFRTANLKDDCTRECPAIAVDFSLPGQRVVAMLDNVAGERGYPDMLVVDNGPELRGRDLDRWVHDHGVKLFFIDPGKPMQNGSIESFNGRFREECLDQSWFTSLAEARRVIEAWRVDYNITRPHTSLRMATPAAFAAARPFAKRQRAPAPELCGNSPPEPVAALTPPVLSGSDGFPYAWPYVGGRVTGRPPIRAGSAQSGSHGRGSRPASPAARPDPSSRPAAAAPRFRSSMLLRRDVVFSVGKLLAGERHYALLSGDCRTHRQAAV